MNRLFSSCLFWSPYQVANLLIALIAVAFVAMAVAAASYLESHRLASTQRDKCILRLQLLQRRAHFSLEFI